MYKIICKTNFNNTIVSYDFIKNISENWKKFNKVSDIIDLNPNDPKLVKKLNRRKNTIIRNLIKKGVK